MKEYRDDNRVPQAGTVDVGGDSGFDSIERRENHHLVSRARGKGKTNLVLYRKSGRWNLPMGVRAISRGISSPLNNGP